MGLSQWVDLRFVNVLEFSGQVLLLQILLEKLKGNISESCGWLQEAAPATLAYPFFV